MLYFWIYNNVKNPNIKINLMGMIQFAKSGIKHIKRRNPSWMLKSQIKGFLMCLKQLLIGPRAF